MRRITVVLIVAVMVSICLAGAVPDATWEPATISLTYSVSVPKDVPFKITKTWGKQDPWALYRVDDYLSMHRRAFRECVRNYIRGKSITEPIRDYRLGYTIDYPIDDRAVVAGHNLAKEQLEKLEKDVGKEKLIERLKDEGYGEEARKPLNSSVEKSLDGLMPEARFDNVPFEDVTEIFRELIGRNIVVNWSVLASAGIQRKVPVTVRLQNVPFRKGLRAALDSAGGATPLDYAVEDGAVYISTKADIDASHRPGKPTRH